MTQKPNCPYNKKHGEFICIDGDWWALTYSECAPPDQRQYWGPCPFCSKLGDPKLIYPGKDDTNDIGRIQGRERLPFHSRSNASIDCPFYSDGNRCRHPGIEG